MEKRKLLRGEGSHIPVQTGRMGGGKRRMSQRSRVDFQVFLLTAAVAVVSCYLIFLINYYSFYNSAIEILQHRALNIHDFLEDRLDNDSFYLLDEKADMDTMLYYHSKVMLEDVRSAAGVRYLYTAKQTETGEFIYLVDGLPEDSSDFRYIGDLIEPECIEDIKVALSGEQVLPYRISKTTWGPVFISYFPMHEGEEVIGVVGIEFEADAQYKVFHRMLILTPLVTIVICILAAVITVKSFRRLSNPSFQDMANTDFLTGLQNRNAFEVFVHNMENRLGRDGTAFLSLDLDGLKSVNDTYGHMTGDEYIRDGAGILQKCVSRTDIVYRIGGDEFCAVIAGGEEEYLRKIAREIREEAEILNDSRDYRVSISIGYAIYDKEQDTTLFDTYKRADAAMYTDKKKKNE